MKIKTIASSFKWVGDFDNRVNDALQDGWRLTKRDTIPGGPNDCALLYAELVLPDPPPTKQEVPDVLTAARIIKDHCNSCQSCRDCLLDDICDLEPPHGWTFQDKGPEA